MKTHTIEIHGNNREHWMIIHWANNMQEAQQAIAYIRANLDVWSNPNRVRVVHMDKVIHEESIA